MDVVEEFDQNTASVRGLSSSDDKVEVADCSRGGKSPTEWECLHYDWPNTWVGCLVHFG